MSDTYKLCDLQKSYFISKKTKKQKSYFIYVVISFFICKISSFQDNSEE